MDRSHFNHIMTTKDKEAMLWFSAESQEFAIESLVDSTICILSRKAGDEIGKAMAYPTDAEIDEICKKLSQIVDPLPPPEDGEVLSPQDFSKQMFSVLKDGWLNEELTFREGEVIQRGRPVDEEELNWWVECAQRQERRAALEKRLNKDG